MERLVRQYAEFLSGDLPVSTEFWEMKKRIKHDKRTPDFLIELNKSTMIRDVISLISDGVIKLEDFEKFRDGMNVRTIYIIKVINMWQV